jgi:hypothetical protein
MTATGTVDVDNTALDLVLSIVPEPDAAIADTAGKVFGAFKIHGPWSDPTITRSGPGKAAGATQSGADPG